MPSPQDRIGNDAPERNDVSEHLEFEPVGRRRSGRKWGRLVAFMILAGSGVGGAWFFWGKSFYEASQQGDTSIIRADTTPIKVKPADPGGMDVPDRDKLVYNRLSGEGAGDKVERLLPPPEEPLPVPESGAGESVQQMEAAMTGPASEATESTAPTALEPIALDPGGEQATDTTEATAPEPSAAPAEEPDVSALSTASEPPNPPTPATEPPNNEMVATSGSSQPEVAPEPAAEPAAETAAETAALPTGDIYRIQLAALRSQDRAASEWERLQQAHPDLLGSLRLSVIRVDLGADKGVFYRLRAGPLKSAETAKSLCESLSARTVGCLVVRPGT